MPNVSSNRLTVQAHTHKAQSTPLGHTKNPFVKGLIGLVVLKSCTLKHYTTELQRWWGYLQSFKHI